MIVVTELYVLVLIIGHYLYIFNMFWRRLECFSFVTNVESLLVQSVALVQIDRVCLVRLSSEQYDVSMLLQTKNL